MLTKKHVKENLVTLGIDIKPEIREEFRKYCELNDLLPSRVLKEFVNNYLEEAKNEAIEINLLFLFYYIFLANFRIFLFFV